MKCRQLREKVAYAHTRLVKENLVSFTWGNVSAIDRKKGCIAIKPSGVAYEALTADTIVLVDLDGKPLEDGLRPSVDTPIHCALYQALPEINAVVHTHAPYATAFAQACMPIPCLGTTHADFCNGPVPLAPALSEEDVQNAYEAATGHSLVAALQGASPRTIPAALTPHHGPFSWGTSPDNAVDAHVTLELLARMAYFTLALSPHASSLPAHMREKHFLRKHGANARYGQDSPHA